MSECPIPSLQEQPENSTLWLSMPHLRTSQVLGCTHQRRLRGMVIKPEAICLIKAWTHTEYAITPILMVGTCLSSTALRIQKNHLCIELSHEYIQRYGIRNMNFQKNSCDTHSLIHDHSRIQGPNPCTPCLSCSSSLLYKLIAKLYF